MVKQLQLLIRLLKDQRVSPLIKVLPVLSLVYLIYPDFIPGPFDDAVVITIFLQIFLSLIPDDLIEELRDNQEIEEDQVTDKDTIIDAEFWEE
jgi:uncharacterized membrane protein YkvA (DUF1232 family)